MCWISSKKFLTKPKMLLVQRYALLTRWVVNNSSGIDELMKFCSNTTNRLYFTQSLFLIGLTPRHCKKVPRIKPPKFFGSLGKSWEHHPDFLIMIMTRRLSENATKRKNEPSPNYWLVADLWNRTPGSAALRGPAAGLRPLSTLFRASSLHNLTHIYYPGSFITAK